MNNAAMEDVEGRFGRPEIMMASSNLMQKVRREKYSLKTVQTITFSDSFTI